MPQEVRREAVRRFGWLRIALLWPGMYEEHFYGADELVSLARASEYGTDEHRFAGVLCRLEMVKT